MIKKMHQSTYSNNKKMFISREYCICRCDLNNLNCFIYVVFELSIDTVISSAS